MARATKTREKTKTKTKVRGGRVVTTTTTKRKAKGTKTKTTTETITELPAKRTRRTPEEARAHILAAARAVLSELGPDKAGLKDIAREAGVSHGLVTHYFGTFEALVEETLALQVMSARERLLSALTDGEQITAARVVHEFFEVVDDPLYGRLAAWALLSGRFENDDFFSRRNKGPASFADAIEAWLAASGRPPIDRDELETMMVLAITTALGYAIGRETLWDSFGRTPTKARDRRFRDLVGDVIERRLTRDDPG